MRNGVVNNICQRIESVLVRTQTSVEAAGSAFDTCHILTSVMLMVVICEHSVIVHWKVDDGHRSIRMVDIYTGMFAAISGNHA